MHERTCPECGAAFEPRYGNQVCCSDECRKARHRRSDKESRRRARGSKDKRALKNDEVLIERVQRMTFAEERREKARRRAEFFAARDRAYARAGLPIPQIEIRDGIRVEWRGQRCIAPRICI